MKKYLILTSVLALAACGGGHDGAQGIQGVQGEQGAPGKSAYDIWVDAGNSGTEQDFLDSLVAGNNTTQNESNVYPVNMQQDLDKYHQDYVATNMDWASQNGYRQYKVTSKGTTNKSATGESYDYVNTVVYNEKELNLANYGVYLQKHSIVHEFDENIDYTNIRAYIHNREGSGMNTYAPENYNLTTFRGGTLAYLYKGTSPYTSSYDVSVEPVLLKGNAEYTHSATDPQLRLEFDNYYTLTMDREGKVSASGVNNTGKSEYTLTSSSLNYVNYGNQYDAQSIADNSALANYKTQPYGTGINDIGFVSKGYGTEEVVGTYSINFERPETNSFSGETRYYNDDIRMTGAFGGTRQ